jgi:hypothetical protein
MRRPTARLEQHLAHILAVIDPTYRNGARSLSCHIRSYLKDHIVNNQLNNRDRQARDTQHSTLLLGYS